MSLNTDNSINGNYTNGHPDNLNGGLSEQDAKIACLREDLRQAEGLSVGEDRTYYDQLNDRLNLTDLLVASRDREFYEIFITKLGLRGNTQALEEVCSFLERLAQVAIPILKLVNLSTLQNADSDERCTFVMATILSTDEEIAEISVKKAEGLRKQRALKAIEIIARRLNEIVLGEGVKNEPLVKKFFLSLKISVGRARCLTTREICRYPFIPKVVFELLAKEQLEDLDFSKVLTGNINACIEGAIPEREIIENRFRVLSERQFRQVVLYLNTALSYLPTDLFGWLNFPALGGLQISCLFLHKEGRAERIALIPVDQMNGAIKNRHMPLELLDLLSDEQIQGLELDKLSKEQILQLFPPFLHAACLEPTSQYSVSGSSAHISHTYTQRDIWGNISRRKYLSNEMVIEALKKREERCEKNLRLVSTKIETIRGKLHSDAQNLLKRDR